MKKTFIFAGLTALILVAGMVFYFYQQASYLELPKQTPQSETIDYSKQPQDNPNFPQTSQNPPPAITPQPKPFLEKPKPQNFIIQADDFIAEPNLITVGFGSEITLIITANTVRTANGLILKSDKVSTGIIPPGMSESVTFIADQSFSLKAYDYKTGKLLSYEIKIQVK